MVLTAIFLLLTVGAALPAPRSIDTPVRFGFCNYPPISADFDTNEFFNKKWYVWKGLGNYFFNRDTSCAGTDAKMVGKDIQLLHFQYEPLLKTYVSVKGNAEADYIKFEGLVFPVHYSLGRHNFSLAFSILGTDYDNWAAVYFCRQLLGVKIEMSWLMTTNRRTLPTGEQQRAMALAVSSVDYTLEDYRLQDNSDCGPREPHL